MIVGHAHIIKNLRRLAGEGQLSHAYLFFGPSVVGKRLVALGLAQYLEGRAFDIPDGKLLQDCLFVKPAEEGSIGIDASRAIKNFLWQKPNVSSRRTVIINQGETMTEEAQNALLKIVEEPPPSSFFMVVTSDPESLLPTLVSRLHKIYFSAVREADIQKWLVSEFLCPEKKAREIAAQSFGLPGIAHSLFEGSIKAAEGEAERFFGGLLRGREAIKELVAKDSFDLRKWLDAHILSLSLERQPERIDAPLWHAILSLRHESRYGTLNARIQLEAIAAGTCRR